MSQTPFQAYINLYVIFCKKKNRPSVVCRGRFFLFTVEFVQVK